MNELVRGLCATEFDQRRRGAEANVVERLRSAINPTPLLRAPTAGRRRRLPRLITELQSVCSAVSCIRLKCTAAIADKELLRCLLTGRRPHPPTPPPRGLLPNSAVLGTPGLTARGSHHLSPGLSTADLFVPHSPMRRHPPGKTDAKGTGANLKQIIC